MPSPRPDFLAPYQADLGGLRGRDRLRALSERGGLDFASNDYLGLAESEEYREAARAALARGVPLGAGGSRLLRGNHPEHEALEEEAARFFGSESALFFGAGFSANEALLATLPQRGDLILYDELIHASAHEGMRLSRATSRAVAHNDAGAFEEAVRAASGAGRVWIVVESLYSMDGDIAPLETLAGIAGRHGAFLLIDEAHATGVLGPGGRGLAHGLEGRDNVVTLHTCGKALGLSGALVCLPRVLREFLINRCRNFIFATAPSPLLAAAIRAALGVIERADDRRGALAERVRRVGEALRRLTDAEPSGTHIQPVIVGSDKRALALAERMQGARPRHSRDTPADGAGGHGAVAHFADAERERCANGRDDRVARARTGGVAVMNARFVIVGTDTGVGKTVFSAALAGALGAFYWKPVQAGLEEETDSQCVLRLSGLPPERILPEAYRLETPASPHLAARLDGLAIDPSRLDPPETAGPLVIETAGGVMTPLTIETPTIDLLARWRLPAIVVARTTLGTINHSLLTLEALRRRDIPLRGVAFIGEANEDTQNTIARMGRVAMLGRLPNLAPLNPETLRRAFAEAFAVADFV